MAALARTRTRRKWRDSPRLKKAEMNLRAANARVRKLKASTAAPAAVAMHSATITAGGAGSGVVSAYFPTVMGIDSRLILGAAVVGVGAWKGDKTGAMMALFGSGFLAAAASDFTESMFTTVTTTEVV